MTDQPITIPTTDLTIDDPPTDDLTIEPSTVLSRSACERLLAEHQVGRVALNSAVGPHILPVTYQFRNGLVIFRTAAKGTLSGLARRKLVAFEVDGINESTGAGWDVVVRGHSSGVVNDHQLRPLWQTGPVPWATGPRTLFIAITPHSITGRRIGAIARGR